MKNTDKTPKDTETILMALDQFSQTIDEMRSVVGRLRTYLQQEAASSDHSKSTPSEIQSDRILH